MRIVVDGLHFTYPGDVQALQDVSLTIESGEQVAVVGQNGAGKTTLVKHLNGLLKPTSGQVFVDDWNTNEHSIAQLSRRVGYIFQNPDDQLFSRTVAAEVAVGPRNLNYRKSRIEELVAHALAQTGLTPVADSNPYDLSPTQRKMVAIAAVLAMDTPVVVFDEPTTGQDAAAVARIGRIVATLAEAGRTVITVTHDIDFAAEHFRRLIALRQGRVLLDGPMRQMVLQQDVLATTAVDPPQLTRLSLALGFKESVITPEEFLDLLKSRSQKE